MLLLCFDDRSKYETPAGSFDHRSNKPNYPCSHACVNKETNRIVRRKKNTPKNPRRDRDSEKGRVGGEGGGGGGGGRRMGNTGGENNLKG